MRYVLAVDPGKMTGCAVWNECDGLVTAVEDEFDPFTERTEAFTRRVTTAGHHLEVVCERFIINAGTVGKTQAPWSLEVIGVCRFLARRVGAGFTLQAPSDAKRFATDARVKALGWWTPGRGHANDATRHLVLFLANQRLIDPVKLLVDG